MKLKTVLGVSILTLGLLLANMWADDYLFHRNVERLRVATIELVVAEQKIIDWGSCKLFLLEAQLPFPDYYCNVTIGYAPMLIEDQRIVKAEIVQLLEDIK